MFRGKYDDALEVLGDVISNGGYQLADTYEDCFSELYDNDKTRDRLWEVQFLNGVEGEGQEFSEICMPENYDGDLAVSGSSAAMHVSDNLRNAYEEEDIRQSVTMITGITVSSAVSEYYWFKKFNDYETKPIQSDYWGVNLPIIRYTDVLLMYVEADNEINGPSSVSIGYVVIP